MRVLRKKKKHVHRFNEHVRTIQRKAGWTTAVWRCVHPGCRKKATITGADM